MYRSWRCCLRSSNTKCSKQAESQLLRSHRSHQACCCSCKTISGRCTARQTRSSGRWTKSKPRTRSVARRQSRRRRCAWGKTRPRDCRSPKHSPRRSCAATCATRGARCGGTSRCRWRAPRAVATLEHRRRRCALLWFFAPAAAAAVRCLTVVADDAIGWMCSKRSPPRVFRAASAPSLMDCATRPWSSAGLCWCAGSRT